jgi:translation initiation factor 3 subunit G
VRADIWDGHVEETGPDEAGVRTVTTYRRNPTTGAKEKVVRRYKRETRVIRISKAAEDRAVWKRFGRAVDGNEGTTARSYDDITFEKPGAEAKDELDKLLAANKSVVVCRKCGAVGDHYTLKCPYGDIRADLIPGGGGSGIGIGDTPSAMDGGDGGASGVGGKYVPPSKRAGAPGADAPGGGGATMDERDLNSLRISNIGEDADEEELRSLFRPYGHIERFYVAKDRDTGASRGFAYITYSMHSEAERAKAALNGFPYEHLILKVREQQHRHNPSGRRRGRAGAGEEASAGTRARAGVCDVPAQPRSPPMRLPRRRPLFDHFLDLASQVDWAKPSNKEREGGLSSMAFVSGYGKALPQNPGGK